MMGLAFFGVLDSLVGFSEASSYATSYAKAPAVKKAPADKLAAALDAAPIL